LICVIEGMYMPLVNGMTNSFPFDLHEV
jgi:hypothetical protein